MEQEVDILGVYISPFALVLGLAVLIGLPLRTYLDRAGFGRYVWHRSLAEACIFVIIVGLLVLIL